MKYIYTVYIYVYAKFLMNSEPAGEEHISNVQSFNTDELLII